MGDSSIASSDTAGSKVEQEIQELSFPAAEEKKRSSRWQHLKAFWGTSARLKQKVRETFLPILSFDERFECEIALLLKYEQIDEQKKDRLKAEYHQNPFIVAMCIRDHSEEKIRAMTMQLDEVQKAWKARSGVELFIYVREECSQLREQLKRLDAQLGAFITNVSGILNSGHAQTKLLCKDPEFLSDLTRHIIQEEHHFEQSFSQIEKKELGLLAQVKRLFRKPREVTIPFTQYSSVAQQRMQLLSAALQQQQFVQGILESNSGEACRRAPEQLEEERLLIQNAFTKQLVRTHEKNELHYQGLVNRLGDDPAILGVYAQILAAEMIYYKMVQCANKLKNEADPRLSEEDWDSLAKSGNLKEFLQALPKGFRGSPSAFYEQLHYIQSYGGLKALTALLKKDLNNRLLHSAC